MNRFIASADDDAASVRRVEGGGRVIRELAVGIAKRPRALSRLEIDRQQFCVEGADVRPVAVDGGRCAGVRAERQREERLPVGEAYGAELLVAAADIND